MAGLIILALLLLFFIAPTVLISIAWITSHRSRHEAARADLAAAAENRGILQDIRELVNRTHDRELRLEERVQRLEERVRDLCERKT